MHKALIRRLAVSCVVVSALTISPLSHAVTILSGPSFTPAPNAPLAGTLQLTTDVDSRVSVLVSDGMNFWEKDFYDYATTHSVPLLGFKPDQTNLILVTVYDKYRQSYSAPQLLTFITDPLPTTFPKTTVLTSEPDRMEPGYTLFMVQVRNYAKNYITMVDNSGQVVWYSPAPGAFDDDVRQLDNGDLFITDSGNRFQEINMLGETVNTLNAPVGWPVDLHDGIPTSHGTVLYISHTNRVVPNFPSSSIISNAALVTVTVQDCPIVEISATNGALLNVWSTLDLLDPTRITYLTYESSGPSGIVDNEHANAVLEDPSDDSIIVSLRNQNAVFKFSRATGQLKWILGAPANWDASWQPYLLSPVGAPFGWNYGQHAPMITPQGTLLVYDDGNFRASPFDITVPDQDNYSRAVEYDIDETNMEVSQVWDSTQANADRLYTPIVGDADWLPQTRNVLVTHGYVTYINGVSPSSAAPKATMVRIRELTHDPVPEVVFDYSIFDYTNTSTGYLGDFVYRSDRIPDLYAHPANPVTDLVVREANTIPCLEFSGDSTRTYVIQASTDLMDWITIGSAVQGEGPGEFDFSDLNARQFNARFYRVVTQ